MQLGFIQASRAAASLQMAMARQSLAFQARQFSLLPLPPLKATFYNEGEVERRQRVPFLTSQPLRPPEFTEATLPGGGTL